MSAEITDGEIPTASVWVWIGLIVIAAISFWCQATVTEERFVPALNVLSTAFNIPDDVAGATLMAAGASSPELFSSIVSLFITHSALGLGTIVGSEIFNQLIICAGAVFAAKSGKLELDKAIVIREVFFYALGILLLFLALQDKRHVEGDAEEHIFISFSDSCMVFVGYIAYVLVCAYMDKVVAFLTGASKTSPTTHVQDSINDYGSMHEYITQTSLHMDKMPFLREKHNLSAEPAGNFRSVELYRTESGGDHSIVKFDNLRSSGGTVEGTDTSKYHSVVGNSLRRMVSVGAGGGRSEGGVYSPFHFLMNTEKPSDEHKLYDVELNSFEDRLCCFMWQRSYFYSKARIAMHGWHLRWFTLEAKRMYSVPNRIHFEKHKIKYPKFETINIDTKRLLIEVIHPDAKKRNFILLCPSEDIYDQVVRKMGKMIDLNMEEKAEEADKQSTDALEPDYDEHMESLIQFPADGNNFEIILFVVLFPFRFLMHYTVPDVRTVDKEGSPSGTLTSAWVAILMCLVWLVIGSYAMVASLEALAALMDIPDAVVGVTVSAAGTSLPNYVASKVAAQNGFGNMAVSNAFGSNTFNIMVGLGMPWLLYTSFGTHFEPYHGLRNEGIVESVIIMGTVCLLFILLMIPSGFVLYKWHAWVFIGLYIMYLAFVIGQVYIQKG